MVIQRAIILSNELSTTGLHNPRAWELRGLIMNENSEQALLLPGKRPLYLAGWEGAKFFLMVQLTSMKQGAAGFIRGGDS